MTIYLHDWLNQCPKCNSSKTVVMDTRLMWDGPEVNRHCNACQHDWMTKVYTNDDEDVIHGDDPEESGR